MSKHWFIASLISKHSKGKLLGLDIGAGNDNWKEFKKCKFVNINKTFPGQIVDIEKEELPFANNSFDVIISINVLNYLINYRVINEIYRVLISGGVFVCVVDNEKAKQPETMTLLKLMDLLKNKFAIKMTLRERFWAWHFNRTSVYACIVVMKK